MTGRADTGLVDVASETASAPEPGARGNAKAIVGNRPLLAGLAIVGVIVLAGAAAPLIAPYSPTTATSDILQRVSLHHLFGTDVNGFDVFSEAIYAPRVDITVAILATIIAVIVGAPAGILAGYRGGALSEISSRLFDILQAFPFFILALFLVAILGPSSRNLVIVLAVVNASIYFRLLRGEAGRLKERKFIEAARVGGCSDWDIMARHVLPNSLVPLLAQTSLTIAWAIMLTAGMSFLGAGVRPPTPEWGLMISSGSQQLQSGHWWVAFFPGLLLAITIVGFALVGNGLSRLGKNTAGEGQL